MKVKSALAGLFAAGMLVASSGVAIAEDVGDKQGWCKKQQGNSRCSGQSECSTRGRQEAPKGQAKTC